MRSCSDVEHPGLGHPLVLWWTGVVLVRTDLTLALLKTDSETLSSFGQLQLHPVAVVAKTQNRCRKLRRTTAIQPPRLAA